MEENVLRHYWYPIALADELTEKPLAMRVLGERVVVYRAGDGLAALRDLCVHRGTPLSLGWVDDDTLVCAYHGWRFGRDGACTHIPSLAADQAIPRKACVPAFRCEERYGLIWVCIDEPHAPIPDYPEAENAEFRTTWTEYYWPANIARIIENVMDFAHFPWVHPGILGDRQQPVYPPVAVERQNGELRYTLDDVATNAVRSYRVTLPFTLHMTVRRRTAEADDPVTNALFFAGCPVSEKETKHFFGYARNHSLDGSDEPFTVGSMNIMAQDEVLVTSQCPEELPLDLAAELHLRGPDAATVAYRRALAELGVRW